MQLAFSPVSLAELKADTLVVGLPDGEWTGFDGVLGGLLATVKADGLFKGEAGETEVLYPVSGLGTRRVVLVGLGKEALTAEAWRKAVGGAVSAVCGKVTSLAIAPPPGLDSVVSMGAAAEAALMAAYDGRLFQTKKDDDEKVIETLILPVEAESRAAEAARRGATLARLVNRARDLSNMPGNKLPVPELRDAVLAVGSAYGLKTQVFEQADLEREGFGCLVGVGKGSQFPPCFVVLEYHGSEDPHEPPVVLVGKGVTFDTGGICIKPRAGMEEMKTDMHGVATVIGVLAAAAERQLPVNLVALCPIAENMPSGKAQRPGDVVRAYNGTTVEVIDTDAEGRLILADALAYGAKHYNARATLDIATLTGSIIMAVGYEASGLFTPDDKLAAELSACGEATGERLWRFPVWDAYDSNLVSDIADVKNVGKEKGDAIHAAMFLKRFAGPGPWAHLDIAGPSFLMDGKDYRPKGSTGVGIRLILEWLERHCVTEK